MNGVIEDFLRFFTVPVALGAMIIAIVMVALFGCGQANRATAVITGYSKVCVDHVSYIQFTSGASVAYGADGKIKKC